MNRIQWSGKPTPDTDEYDPNAKPKLRVGSFVVRLGLMAIGFGIVVANPGPSWVIGAVVANAFLLFTLRWI